MTNQHHSNNEKKSSDFVLKLSVFLLVIVMLFAVTWVLFLADDGSNDLLKPNDLPVEKIETKIEGKNNDVLATSFIPVFDIVRIGRKGTGVIAGRAQPHSDIDIFASNKGKVKLIGTAVADRNGEWVFLFDDPLEDGPTELSLKSRMPGSLEIQSSDVVIVVVPEKSTDHFMDGEDSGVIAVLTPREGQGASRILQRPRTINIQDLSKGLALDSIDYSSEGKIDFTGRAEAGMKIRIYLDQKFLSEVTAGEDGVWHHTVQMKLSNQEHILRIDQLLLGDDVEVRIEQRFTPTSEIDFKSAKGSVIVRPGNSLWHIARRLYGEGFHYTIIFGANRELIRDPNLIYPGQKFDIPLNKEALRKKTDNSKKDLSTKVDQKLKEMNKQINEIEQKINPKKQN